MQGKVAILGDADFVMPFSALGVDTYPVGDTAEQMRESADKIVSGKYALVVVAENIAKAVGEVFSAYQDAPTPCIIMVPFTIEPTGIATMELGKAIKVATGINILKND
jgi:V/A-type H+-transporting ATPase subunit F